MALILLQQLSVFLCSKNTKTKQIVMIFVIVVGWMVPSPSSNDAFACHANIRMNGQHFLKNFMKIAHNCIKINGNDKVKNLLECQTLFLQTYIYSQ